MQDSNGSEITISLCSPSLEQIITQTDADENIQVSGVLSSCLDSVCSVLSVEKQKR
jgi:hypothetical protein